MAGTVILPTPVLPPNTGPQLKPTLPPLIVTPMPPPPTKRPDEPYQRTISPTLPAPDTARTVPAVALVVLGTVSEVLAARWTTPDGTRPVNPHAGPPFYSIFTPVRVGVEAVLKGTTPLSEVMLSLQGGQVGQDYLRIDNQTYVPFQTSERTVLFLNPTSASPNSFNGSALWEIWERYTVEGETAKHPVRTLPLQQLITEINAALGAPTPTPGATPAQP